MLRYHVESERAAAAVAAAAARAAAGKIFRRSFHSYLLSGLRYPRYFATFATST